MPPSYACARGAAPSTARPPPSASRPPPSAARPRCAEHRTKVLLRGRWPADPAASVAVGVVSVAVGVASLSLKTWAHSGHVQLRLMYASPRGCDNRQLHFFSIVRNAFSSSACSVFFSSHHLHCTDHLPSRNWRVLPSATLSLSAGSTRSPIPPRRRARGATRQNVTPNKLFEPKHDYDVINANLIEKYDCHTTTAALH